MRRFRIPGLLAPLALLCVFQAQGAGMPRVGVLANTVPIGELVDGTTTHPGPRLLLEGLREKGWIPDRNVKMVWRSAESDYARLPQLARELAAECDVIVVYGPGLDAAMEVTTKVPIVMGASGVEG